MDFLMTEIRKYTYTSVLGPYIDDFINEKRALGYIYNAEAYELYRLDNYWNDHCYSDPCMSFEMLDEWLSAKPGEGKTDSKEYWKKYHFHTDALLFRSSVIQHIDLKICHSFKEFEHIFSDSIRQILKFPLVLVEKFRQAEYIILVFSDILAVNLLAGGFSV